MVDETKSDADSADEGKGTPAPALANVLSSRIDEDAAVAVPNTVLGDSVLEGAEEKEKPLGHPETVVNMSSERLLPPELVEGSGKRRLDAALPRSFQNANSQIDTYRWVALGDSIRGPQHARNNLPNQDYWGFESVPDASLLVFSVADGHGSKRSMRSHLGSQWAVQESLKALSGLKDTELSLSQIKHQAVDSYPKALIKNWRRRITAHCENQQPFSPAEREILGNKTDNHFLAYGSTLLSVVVTETFIGYWQLGDGDMLAVWRDGRVERPLPKDARLIANETTSLCSSEAWKEFRVLIQPLAGDPPDLILLCTDGYSNSFAEEAGFFQAGRDFLDLLDTEGLAFVQNNVADWLWQTSEAGSGDDTTLGLIWRESQTEVEHSKRTHQF